MRTIWESEVLEMDVRFRIQLSSGLYEGIHEFVILLAAYSRFFETKVKIIVQKLFIICPAVKDHWKCSIRMDSSTQCS